MTGPQHAEARGNDNVSRRLRPAIALGPVRCHRCAAEWRIDPALLLDCPSCQAAAGQPCQRVTSGNGIACMARDRAAVRGGLLDPCPALTWDGRHAKPLPLGAVA